MAIPMFLSILLSTLNIPAVVVLDRFTARNRANLLFMTCDAYLRSVAWAKPDHVQHNNSSLK